MSLISLRGSYLELLEAQLAADPYCPTDQDMRTAMAVYLKAKRHLRRAMREFTRQRLSESTRKHRFVDALTQCRAARNALERIDRRRAAQATASIVRELEARSFNRRYVGRNSR